MLHKASRGGWFRNCVRGWVCALAILNLLGDVRLLPPEVDSGGSILIRLEGLSSHQKARVERAPTLSPSSEGSFQFSEVVAGDWGQSVIRVPAGDFREGYYRAIVDQGAPPALSRLRIPTSLQSVSVGQTLRLAPGAAFDEPRPTDVAGAKLVIHPAAGSASISRLRLVPLGGVEARPDGSVYFQNRKVARVDQQGAALSVSFLPQASADAVEAVARQVELIPSAGDLSRVYLLVQWDWTNPIGLSASPQAQTVMVQTDCGGAQDVVLVLDRSLAMTAIQFDQMLEAARRFISGFPLARGYQQLGLVSFCEEASAHTPLLGDRAELLAALNRIKRGARLEKVSCDRTYLGAGLDSGRLMLSNAGPRRTIVLLSQGHEIAPASVAASWAKGSAAVAHKAKVSGIRVVTLALGESADAAHMNELATERSDAFAVSDLNSLDDTLRGAVVSRCSADDPLPAIDPGPDRVVWLPDGLELAGDCPHCGPDAEAGWRVSDDSAGVFIESRGFSASARFAATGDYQLELHVTDQGFHSVSNLHVAVLQSNQPPVIIASVESTGRNERLLVGQVTDDGIGSDSRRTSSLPSLLWKQASGPARAIIERPDRASSFARFDQPGAYAFELVATDPGGLTSSARVQALIDPAEASVESFKGVGYASAAVGGLRDVGEGLIQLEGVRGPVIQAILVWHGPVDSENPAANAQVLFQGHWVAGQSIGMSHDDHWLYSQSHPYATGQGYRANVTAWVSGDGSYRLQHCVKTPQVNANGASLLVVFEEPDPGRRRDVTLWTGNDSNGEWAAALNGKVNALTVRTDGRVILAGPFTEAAGFPRFHLVRLMPDGEIDHDFNPGTGISDEILCVGSLANGQILAGGRFVTPMQTNGLARWNADGSRDAGFNPSLPPRTQVRCLLEADGLVWAGGSDGLWSVTPGGVASLRVGGSVNALIRTRDGVLWAGGEFKSGSRTARLLRLPPGGAIDLRMISIDGPVQALADASDGRLFVGGAFQSVDGQQRHGVARLLGDGSLDLAWVPEALNEIPEQDVRTLLTQPEGEEGLASGSLLIVGGRLRLRGNEGPEMVSLLRLVEGRVEGDSFERMGLQGDEVVEALALANPQGNMWVAGKFDRAFTKNRLQIDSSGRVVETNQGDEGWSQLLTVPAPIAEAEIELHVSDGQSANGVDYLDPVVLINGETWLQPETGTICDREQDQLFSGTTVPNANHGCEENLGLWDVIRRKAPASALTRSKWTLTSRYDGPQSEQDLVSLVAVAVLTPPTDPAPRRLDMLVTRDDEFTLSRSAGPARWDVLGNDKLPGPVRIERLIGDTQGRVDVAEDGSSLLFHGADEGDQEATLEFDYVVSSLSTLSATGHVVLRLSDALPPLLPQGASSRQGRLGSSPSPTRGLNRYADVYRYDALEPQTLSIEVHSPEFPGHLYLRDPQGDLIAADWHSSEEFGAHEPRKSSLSITHPIATPGIYWIEVAGNSPEDRGDYELRVDHFLENESPLAIWIDGLPMSPSMNLGGLDPRGRLVQARLQNQSPDRSLTVSLAAFPVTWGLEAVPSSDDSVVLEPRGTRTVTCLLKADGMPVGASLAAELTFHTIGFPSRTTRAELVSAPDQPSLWLKAAVEGEGRLQMSVQSLSGDALSGIVFVADSSAGQQLRSSNSGELIWEDIGPGDFVLWAYSDQDLSQRVRLNATKPDLFSAARPDSYLLNMNSGPVVLGVLTNDLGGLRLASVSPGLLGATEALPGQGIRYTPRNNATGVDQFTYIATDQAQRSYEAVVTVRLTPLRVEWIEPETGTVFDPGRTIRLATRVDRSAGPVAVERIWDGEELIAENFSPPWTAEWRPQTPGFHSLVAEILDDTGSWHRSTVLVIGLATESDHPPEGIIRSPVERELVREGELRVRGVAYDPDGPASYSLVLTRADGGVVFEIAGAAQSPEEQDLGTFDLTLLRNGLYTVSLCVTGGVQVATHAVSFGLQSDLKIGRLSFTTTDLRLPTLGVPLVIARTYDSLQPAAGDFGPGWSMAMYDMQIELDEERSEAEDVDTGERFMMRTGGGRNMALTLPGGERLVFNFALAPGAAEGGVPCFCYTAEWKSAPGVAASLTAVGNRELRFVPFQKEMPPFWVDAGPETPFENYDFRGWVLTNSDGSVFHIEREYQGAHALESSSSLMRQATAYGAPKLRAVRARTGERIEIEQGSRIDHIDAGNRRTVSVVLRRDDSGRVTEIYDPQAIGDDGSVLPGALPSLRYQYDSQSGNLTAVQQLQDRQGAVYSTERYEYAHPRYPHYLTRVVDDRGVTVSRQEFDDAGRLTQISDASGVATQYLHDLARRKEEIVSPSGRRVVHEYDARGNRVRSVDASGAITARSFDEYQHVIAETNALGTEIESWTLREFDEAGRVVAVTNLLGVQRMGYGRSGELLWQMNPSGAVLTNVYDASGRLQSASWTAGSLGTKRSFEYDEAGRLRSIDDGSGALQEASYDAAGRVSDVKIRGAANEVMGWVGYQYDRNGNRVAETTQRTVREGAMETSTTFHRYDARNRCVAVTNALGGVLEWRYDSDGRVVAQKDELERETFFTRDRRGLVVQTIPPHDGATPRTVARTYYDEQGREVLSMQPTFLADDEDPYNGSLTSAGEYIEYDEAGRVARTGRCKDLTLAIEPDADGIPRIRLEGFPTLLSTNETHYDALGRVSWLRNVAGVITAFGYDDAGHQTSVTNALGTPLQTVTRSVFGADGLLRASIDPGGGRFDYEYDALQRLIRTWLPEVDGARDSVGVGYDAAGREVARTNEMRGVTLYGHDVLGRLTSVTNAFGTPEQSVTRFVLDEAGQRVRQVDGLGRETHCEYDALGRRVRRQLPGGESERAVYDAAGNPIWKTNFNGRVIRQDYDARNRLLRRTEVGPVGETQLAAFLYTQTGLRAFQEDPSGATFYTYDDFDRMRTKDKPGWGRLDYEYLADGRLVSTWVRAAGEEWETRYEYDMLGRLIAAELPSHGLGARYTLDAAGRVQSSLFANGMTHRFDYDSRNNAQRVSWRRDAQILAQFDYRRNAMGQAMRMEESFYRDGARVARVYDWSYDGLNRLTRETLGDQSEIRYRYDSVGNRLEQVSTSSLIPSRVWHYDVNDRVDRDADPTNPNPDFDANGNALGGVEAGKQHEDLYDAENRLVERRMR
ncbi:MAG: VWA domain-containing protein [Verrucomicrobia bacterium]|nr:VWA domain-containing protein [Verrucomicrobiota bacterium]